MKYHVQFLTTSVVNKNIVVEALGSDAVFILDGRNNLTTMIEDAKLRMKQLASVQNYVGFVIKQGARFGYCKAIHTSKLPPTSL